MPWCEAMLARIGSGDVQGALAEIDTRLATDPGAFYARWLRGLALTQLGDRAAGEKEDRAAHFRMIRSRIGHHWRTGRRSRSWRPAKACVYR
jgi:hypothetical protein